MSGLYVASNVQALGAQNMLSRNMGDLQTVMTRLSTGLRINSAKDDPAGLIASELLKSDMIATTKAISNTQRANSVIGLADSALGQVSSLLNDIRGLVVESANTGAMSDAQIQANQIQIDASLDSIDRIAKTTNYQGQKLLDGSLDFSTTGVGGSGISNLAIQSANFGTASEVGVKVDVQEAAKKGTLIYQGSGVGQDTVLRIGGSKGSELFNFGANTTNAQMAEAINKLSDSTGVVARVAGEEQRGSVTLSSVGANNDIVITANKKGFDEGNYTFRIVKGPTEGATVVSEPTSTKPGVIEVSLGASYQASHANFVDMFNVNISTDYAGGSSGTSVSITRGEKNTAVFLEQAKAATGTSVDKAKTLQIKQAGDGNMSSMNGWTFVVASDTTAADTTYDDNAKVAYISFDNTANAGAAGAFDTQVATAVSRISGASLASVGADPAALDDALIAATVGFTGAYTVGDRVTIDGGGAAGELVVTYKAGATAGEILDLMNKAPNVSASLVAGVEKSDLISNLPSDPTFVTSGNSVESDYLSNATASQVVDIINNSLGDLFTASLLNKDSGSGKVGFMNAAAYYGDPNNDNGLVFHGMDSGPVVRMVTTDSQGNAIKNQELSVTLINPTDADIAAGRTTKILQINLATDGAGNSITTAKDIADLFDRLNASETLGVSAEVLLPEGVDPNGRVWTTDVCDNENVIEGCGAVYGLGIVGPTGVAGPCEIQENDIVLLGDNQTLQSVGKPQARIASSTTIDPLAATATDADANQANATVSLQFGTTSAVNGMSFSFTADASRAGFDATSGRLTVYVDPTTLAKIDDANAAVGTPEATAFTDAVTIAINGALKENWADIREFTKSTGNAPELRGITYGTDFTDLTAMIDATEADGSLRKLSVVTDINGIAAQSETGSIGVANNGNASNIAFSFEYEGSTMNGINVVFDNAAAATAFDSGTKTLTVKGTAISAAADSQATADAIAAQLKTAIEANIDAIRAASGSKDTGTTIDVTAKFTQPEGDPAVTHITAAELDTLASTTAGGGATKFDAVADIPAEANGGVSSNDPALIITAKEKGTAMAGAKVAFEEDGGVNVGEIEVGYDKASKTLTVRANTGGAGMSATQLANLLNSSADFLTYFERINLQGGVTPGATVAFKSDGTTSGTFTGGYEIITEENEGNTVSNKTGTSSGIVMRGQSDANDQLILEATDYGSSNFVNVDVIQGNFRTFCPLGLEMNHLAGTDAVVTVNGQKTRAQGNDVTLSSSTLQMTFSIDPNMKGGESTEFTVTGGGAVFQLGPQVESAQQIRVGIQSVDTGSLGGASGKLYQLRTGGNADMFTDTNLADRIVNEAISSIASTRGRLGAIQRSTLDPNIAALQDSLEALSSAEAQISNADFAEESSKLARLQILVQSGASILAQTNQLPQYAAMLVG